MTHFITVSNRRGGVGKTTTTAMLAYGFSVLGFQNVLVIDLDAQSSTSITLMGHERWHLARRDARTISELLLELFGDGQPDFASYAAPQVGDVHISPGNRRPLLAAIPGSFDLDETERYLLISGRAGPTLDTVFQEMQSRVAQLIRGLDGLYDVVIMDCPPGLSNVAWGAVEAADYVVVPYIPDATAEDNVGWIVNRILQLDEKKQVRVLANRVRMNNPHQRGTIDAIMARYPSLGIALPQRASIEGALEFRAMPQSLNQKFGDGHRSLEELFNATLSWVEDTRRGAAA